MSFKELHKYASTLELPISRNKLRPKVLELTGIPLIREMHTTLDTTICRGFYLSAKNTEHPIVKQFGSHVIVLARELKENWCWERFVYVKELMHAFDDPKEATDSGEKFDRLLSELQTGSLERSPQILSEIKCFWMALAVLCPEEKRKEFINLHKVGHIDDYGIALKLRVPKQYVPSLLEPQFDAKLKDLLS